MTDITAEIGDDNSLLVLDDDAPFRQRLARAMEKRLNDLGASRWECFWVETTGTKKRFYMKKAGRSYLKQIPSTDLLKLLPGVGSE